MPMLPRARWPRAEGRRLLMLTDVKGVLDAKGKIIPRLSQARARALIRNGTAKDGMIRNGNRHRRG